MAVAPSAVRAAWLLATLLLGNPNAVSYVAGDLTTDTTDTTTSTASELDWANDVDDVLDRFDVVTNTNSTRLARLQTRSCGSRS